MPATLTMGTILSNGRAGGDKSESCGGIDGNTNKAVSLKAKPAKGRKANGRRRPVMAMWDRGSVVIVGLVEKEESRASLPAHTIIIQTDGLNPGA